jgi:hypothetical protein
MFVWVSQIGLSLLHWALNWHCTHVCVVRSHDGVGALHWRSSVHPTCPSGDFETLDPQPATRAISSMRMPTTKKL